MKTIAVFSNYTSPAIIRQSPGHSGVWGQYKFVFDRVDSADFLVVLNYPLEDTFISVREGGKILIMQEPPYNRNLYYKDYFKYFDLVISHFDGVKNGVKIPPFLPWLVEGDYDYFMNKSFREFKTSDVPVWVTSNALVNPGHQPRLDFIEFLKKKEFNFHLWGRGFNPVQNKNDVFINAKYVIAVENYFDKDYFTEKIIDPILMGCFVFYYGCPNIDEYLPEGCFAHIDLNDFDKSQKIIEDKISSNAWENGLDSITEAKYRILNSLQFFPALTTYLDKINLGEFQNHFIPKDPNLHLSLFQKISRRFKRKRK